jgi:hypothetical protein
MITLRKQILNKQPISTSQETWKNKNKLSSKLLQGKNIINVRAEISEIVWRADYEKTVRTGHKQGEMHLSLRCLSVGQDRHSPGHRRGKYRTAVSPNLK